MVSAIALGLGDAWAAWQWSSSKSEMETAADQLAACESLADEIVSLQSAPKRVDDASKSSDSLAAIVETAAKKSNLPTDHIVHIEPGDPRRIADSPYEAQSTEVEMREISLRQLIEFALTVTNATPGLRVSSLAIRFPPDSPNPKPDKEMWNAQMVLTSHIYAPKMLPPSPP